MDSLKVESQLLVGKMDLVVWREQLEEVAGSVARLLKETQMAGAVLAGLVEQLPVVGHPRRMARSRL